MQAEFTSLPPGWRAPAAGLTAIFGIEGEPVPTALDIACIGLAKTRRGAHHVVFEDTAGAVGRLVERRELVARELRRLLEDLSVRSGETAS